MNPSARRGLAPIIIILIVALVGATGIGTTVLANNSKPGDPLFGLDKALEEFQVAAATNDRAKTKIRLEIANERLGELEAELETNQPVEPAVSETQQALTTATSALASVETKFKENKITLTSTDLQALLTELQNLLATHQGLIRRIEIKIKDGQVRAKIKFFEQEASESAELVEDDLDDLEDDGLLNASFAKMIEVELRGLLIKAGSLFQLTSGEKTYSLVAAASINLDGFVGKTVELEGFAQNTSPTDVTVTKIKIEEEKKMEEKKIEEELPGVEARGFVRQGGTGFVLIINGGTPLYTLASTKINLSKFVGKFVKVEGELSGNVLNVLEIEVKKTDSSGQPVTPALSTSGTGGTVREEEEKEGEKDGDRESESSGSGRSGSSEKDKD